MRPQPVRVEAGHRVEHIVRSAVRVAAAVVQLGQLSEHRKIDRTAQGRFKFGHLGDGLAPENIHQSLRIEVNMIHIVRLTPNLTQSSVTLTLSTALALASFNLPCPLSDIMLQLVHNPTTSRHPTSILSALCQYN